VSQVLKDVYRSITLLCQECHEGELVPCGDTTIGEPMFRCDGCHRVQVYAEAGWRPARVGDF